MPERMAVVVFSGAVDRLLGLATLVLAAAASGMEVYILLQLWGVYAMRKDVVEKNTEFSEFEELKPKVQEGLKRIKVRPWIEMIREAKEVGTVKIYACSQALQAWGITKDDLVDVVDDVMGAAEFLDISRDANITYFV